MSETMQTDTVVGPFWRRLPEERGPHCTACGSSMTAVAFATVKGAEAVLCCDGCGRRGVFCTCRDPWAPKA